MKLKVLFSFILLITSFGCFADSSDNYTVVSKEQSKTFSGKVIYASKNMVYIGELKDGQRHGYGVAYGKIGTVMAGNWENDKFLGDGVIVSYDINSVSAGNFNGSELIGKGVMSYDGEVITGVFEEGSAIPSDSTCYRNGSTIPCEDSVLFQ